MPSGRTAMYSPEGIFPLGITHLSRPAAKLNKKVFRPERTVCVQSRKRFFTRDNPFIPACHEKFRTVRAHKQKKKSRKNQIKRFFLFFCVCFFQKCYSQNPPPAISLRWQSPDILTLSHSPANLSDFWLFIFFNSLCQLIGAGSVFSPAEVSL